MEKKLERKSQHKSEWDKVILKTENIEGSWSGSRGYSYWWSRSSSWRRSWRRSCSRGKIK